MENLNANESAANGDATEHGSNGATELTAEERKALFFHHFSKVVDQKAILDKENEEYKRLRKLAKADGLLLADVDFAMRCAEIDDTDIVASELKRRTEIASWFALPVSFQSDLFTDYADGMDRIDREGEAAGLAGKPIDCHDYTKGSVEAETFEHGHDRGQKTLLDNLTSAMEKKNAEKAEAEQAKLIKAAAAQDDADEDSEDADPFDDDDPGDQDEASQPSESRVH